MSVAEMRAGAVCPGCSKANECSMEKGETTCWCFALPHVLPVGETEGADRCYCRGCLSRMIEVGGWLDVPMVYEDGRRAILAIEKGPPGEHVFEEAFEFWSSNPDAHR